MQLLNYSLIQILLHNISGDYILLIFYKNPYIVEIENITDYPLQDQGGAEKMSYFFLIIDNFFWIRNLKFIGVASILRR
jgi:hypothetical protein